MRISKQTVGGLQMPYAVSCGCTDGKAFFLGASEARGQGALRIAADTLTCRKLWDGPGGCMNLIQDPAHDDMLWGIQKFFPVFDAREAEVVRFVKRDGRWQSSVAANVPYAHRIALYEFSGEEHLLVCQLCGDKAFQNDWSVSGGVYTGKIDAETGTAVLRPVLRGLHKNHGLTDCREAGYFLVSCAEGVFRLWIDREEPQIERLLDRESSEAVLFDLDGDGRKELITVNGFHGNQINIWSPAPQFRHMCSIPANFCHVLLVETIGGKPALISANRGGGKEICLHMPFKSHGELQFDTHLIDAGVGATQICALRQGGALRLFSANHDRDELAVYTIA